MFDLCSLDESGVDVGLGEDVSLAQSSFKLVLQLARFRSRLEMVDDLRTRWKARVAGSKPRQVEKAHS